MRTLGVGIGITLKKLKKWRVNYNVNGHIKIPKFSVEPGDEMNFDLVIFGHHTSINNVIFDAISPRCYVAFLVSNKFNASMNSSNNINITINGKQDDIVNLNTLVSVKVVFKLTHDIEFIASNYVGEGATKGQISNVRMTSKNAERFYPSIISSPNRPNVHYLEDTLNTWRGDSYIYKSIHKTQFISIEPWHYNIGDSIIVGFVWLDEISTWNNILDADISDIINRPYFGIDTLKNLSWNRAVFHDPIQQNGEPVEKPIIGKHYTYILKPKIKGSPIGTLGNNVGSRLEAFSGYLTILELLSTSDPRNYQMTIQADTQPTTDTVKELNNRQDILVKGLDVTKRSRFAHSTPSYYQSVLPKTATPWSNGLSTDGKFINFGDEGWIEMK